MEAEERDIRILTHRMLEFIDTQYTIIPDGDDITVVGKHGIRTDFDRWVRETVNGMLNTEEPDTLAKVCHCVLEELDAKFRKPKPKGVSLFRGSLPDLDAVKSEVKTSAKVIIKNGLYVWTGGYKTKDLPKSAGFRWDSGSRKWWTDNPENARKLFEYSDYRARSEMGAPNVPDIMDDDCITLIHTALRELAFACDWAKKRDYRGFGKSDAFVGHTLAGKSELNRNQAALGIRLIVLHRRQLDNWLLEALKPFIEVAQGVANNG